MLEYVDIFSTNLQTGGTVTERFPIVGNNVTVQTGKEAGVTANAAGTLLRWR